VKTIYKLILIATLVFLVGWQTNKANMILTESVHIDKVGERIAFISSKFIDTPYMARTMKGSPDDKEELVINLDGMDCFTFLDYVEALRLSVRVDNFIENLKKVRYFNGEVNYAKRKHFFTDWVSGENNTVRDITSGLPGATTVEKIINRKSDKTNWLKNVPQTMRMVNYIPGNQVSKDVIKLLQTGDYIGIYSDKQGLDVTHTGIFIKNKKGEFFRNTSSKLMKVTDYPFKDYVKEIKGIIVFRPQ